MRIAQRSRSLQAFLVLLGLTCHSLVVAQNCRVDVPVPLPGWGILDDTFNPGGAVSADGTRVLLRARASAAPNAPFEVFVINPFTFAIRQITSNTPLDFRGENGGAITRLSADGRFLVLGTGGGFGNTVINGQQLPTIETLGQPIRVFELSTGAARTLGSLNNRALASDELYAATFGGSINGGSMQIDEAIYRFTIVTDANTGRRYRSVVLPAVINASARYFLDSGLIDARNLLSTIDLAQAEFARRISLPPYTLNGEATQIFLSDDGNALSFASTFALDRGGLATRNLPGNSSGIARTAFVYYRDLNQILEVGQANLASTPLPPGASNQIFTRNISRSGRLFALDRGAEYLGAPTNPTRQAAPAWTRPGEVPRYIVPPSSNLPERGLFANSLAYVSRDERFVYFGHTSDLVPTNNLERSLEMFRFELANGQIRQISDQNDLLASFPTDVLTNQSAQLQLAFNGASDDGRIVAFTRNAFAPTYALTRINGQLRARVNDTVTLFSIVRCN